MMLILMAYFEWRNKKLKSYQAQIFGFGIQKGKQSTTYCFFFMSLRAYYFDDQTQIMNDE